MNNEFQVSLSDHLPLWHFDGEALVFADGSVGVGFEIKGRDISSAEPERINEFSKNT